MVKLFLRSLLGVSVWYVLMLFVAGQASAQTFVTFFRVTLTNQGGVIFRSLDASAVCSAKTDDYNIKVTGTKYVFASAAGTGNASGSCYATKPPSTSLFEVGTWGKTTCTGATPYFDPAVGCVATQPPPDPKPCNDKNEFIRRWDYPAGGVTPPPNHYGQCQIEVIKLLVCRKDPAGLTYCMWLVKRTGIPYDGPADGGGGDGSDGPENPKDTPSNSPPIKPPPAPPGKNPCPAGTVQAGSAADGTPMCVGTGTNPPNKPAPPPKIETEKSEQQSDGSTKTTKTETITNSDGSTTTNTTVTITRPDGSKETTGGTNTSNNSAGQPGKADNPDDKYDLCKQNPMLSICRESSVSGTCGQITCVGDAIQCATLRAAAAMQCEQAADKEALSQSPLKATGQGILDGADPEKAAIDAALKGTEVDLSKSALDQNGFVSGNACFADKTFTVMGKQVVVSFARVCQDIQPLRAVVMACAFLVAYLIVGRSIVNG